MSAFIHHQKCFITTLSPVHMGAGEDYYPTQYVIDDGLLYAFDELQMSQALGVGMMLDLAKLAETNRDAITAMQKKIYENKDKLTLVAEQCIPVSAGIFSKYCEVLKGSRNEMAIQRTFYNPYDHLPVISGSGVKGSIRTALLDQLNNNKPLSHTLKAERNAATLLQKTLLDFEKVEEDPFRVLKISDAGYRHKDTLQATEVLYAVSRKRNPIVGRKPNSTTVMLECVSPWRARSFAFDFSLLDRSHVKNSNVNQLPKDIAAFAAVCNRYYRPKLEQEIRFLNEKGYSQSGNAEAAWSKGLRGLLTNELKIALDENRVFLLKLGKHGGAEDKTLSGVRSIKIMLGKGEKPENRDKTTEVRLAAQAVSDEKGLMPFGWVLVEVGEQSLPDTMAFIAEMAKPAYMLQEKDAKRIEQRQKLLAEQKILKIQVLEKQQADAEKEAELQQQLAALSVEQKIMHDLQQRVLNNESTNAGPGCALGNDIGKLIETAATEWELIYKLELKLLAVSIYMHLGVDAKNNKKVKERLRLLG